MNYEMIFDSDLVNDDLILEGTLPHINLVPHIDIRLKTAFAERKMSLAGCHHGSHIASKSNILTCIAFLVTLSVIPAILTAPLLF